MRDDLYRELDAALERLSGYGIALDNRNSNHAPMVVEALCAMGRPDAVTPWLDRYCRRLLSRGDGPPIDPQDWRAALGRRDNFAAWADFFAAELRDGAWLDTLDRWAGRLAPGFAGAATHGVLRVGHAARALSAGETPPRRRELADALASWATVYSELPAAGVPADDMATGPLPPREAIAQVALVPPERRKPGNITAALARLQETPEFAAAIGLADLCGDPAGRVAELGELFARLYLANARTTLTAIVFIHGVTSVAAAGHIAAATGERTGRALLRYGWQAGCGLFACFGQTAGLDGPPEPVAGDDEALAAAAVAHGDEHAIKFTEACLGLNARRPSPTYRAAVRSALALLRPLER